MKTYSKMSHHKIYKYPRHDETSFEIFFCSKIFIYGIGEGTGARWPSQIIKTKFLEKKKNK